MEYYDDRKEFEEVFEQNINQSSHSCRNHSCGSYGNQGNQGNRIRVSDAVIDEISFDQRNAFVTITYRENVGGRWQSQTVRLVVGRNTTIRDERGRNISARELQTGMIVNASFSSAMTRSIPPQAEAFEIRVVQRPSNVAITEGRIMQVDVRGQFIVTVGNNNPSSTIRFNIMPETRILDPLGRRISLNNLFPGLLVRVEHATFMTASIPPQTTAFVIRIIGA